MLEYIYNALSYLIKKNLPEVKSVEIYTKDKDGVSKGTKTRQVPFILIELGNFNFEQRNNKIQHVEININLHVFIDMPMDIIDNEMMLKYLRIFDNMYIRLSSMSHLNLDNKNQSEIYKLYYLTRTGLVVDKSNETRKEYIISFSCGIEDKSLQPEFYNAIVNEYDITVNKVIE